MGVWEYAGGFLPFLEGYSSAVQPCWLFPVTELASQVTCLVHLVHQKLLESPWFWLFTVVLAQFSMIDSCQFFWAFCSGWMFSSLGTVMSIMRPDCSLWFISTMSDRLWNRCLSAWMISPRGSWRDHSWLLVSGFIHQSLQCSRLYAAQMSLYTIEATLLSLTVLGLCKLAAALLICATVSACCWHNLHLVSCTVWQISCATALVLRARSWAAIIRASVAVVAATAVVMG